MELGLVGPGRMGKPIGLNLLKAGLRLTVVDRSNAAFPVFEAAGAVTSTDVWDLAAADVIFLCPPDAEAIREVLFEPPGLALHLPAGRIIVDLGTTSHAKTLRIARSLAERDIAFVDAPVTGEPTQAIDGTLTITCGGPGQTVTQIHPLLEQVGTPVHHMGELGSGQVARLVTQFLFHVNMEALAEALPMADFMGLDPERVAAIVDAGASHSFASRVFLPRILEGRFHNGYPIGNARRDLANAAELCSDHGLSMPMMSAAASVYQQAMLKGLDAHDQGGLIQIYENLTGQASRAGPAALPSAGG